MVINGGMREWVTLNVCGNLSTSRFLLDGIQYCTWSHMPCVGAPMMSVSHTHAAFVVLHGPVRALPGVASDGM